MLFSRPALRSLTTTCAALAVAGAGLAVTTPAAQAAAPVLQEAAVRNSSTVILSWAKVSKATTYDVQVDTNANFSSPDYTSKTANTRSVPTKALRSGKNYWRVRATVAGQITAWSVGTFEIAQITTPIPLAPENNDVLKQPQRPPLLQWSPSQGATSYVVTVDGDADMIGAKAYTTSTTSLILPSPLTEGDWFWRVRAVKTSDQVSLSSDVSRFEIVGLDAPEITEPVDSVDQEIEDVVVDWTPVPGAAYYDVQIALDDDFNNIANSVTNVQSTRYSPPVTLNSDQFWWRVRAVDVAGQPTPWTESVFGFKRRWPDVPVPVYPLGTEESPANMGSKPFFQWEPVQHATSYELQVSTNVNFSPDPAVTKTCKTAATTYAPRARFLPDDCQFATGTKIYWRVRPIDAPYPVSTGLPGLFSPTQVAIYKRPPRLGTDEDWDNQALVTGMKVALDGTGAVGSGGCTPTELADICNNAPSTPVLSWDPVPGANFYLVYYAQDEDFTTTEITPIPVTNNTIFQLQMGSPAVTADRMSQLPENEAGSAYYWHVRPCLSSADCGPDPLSHVTLPDTRAFRKKSPAIVDLKTSPTDASEITFEWDDYYDTNRDVVWGGEQGNQTAKNYRFQIDNDISFGSPIDTRVVDQTTVTAYDEMYPDGTFFWRVQALDEEDNGLAWSDVKSFTKTSPPVTLSSPVNGVHVQGTLPFRWDAQPFATAYTVEVYKNNDLTFSAANRVVSASVKMNAFTPSTPIPASSQPYVWRVRRTDPSGNAGPWSTPGVFYSEGIAPNLLSPPAGGWLKSSGLVFEWSEVPGATSYSLNMGGDSTTTIKTVATAYAPSSLADGHRTWNVTAYDSKGNPLATSATRQFDADSTAPKVKKVGPAKLKASSTLKAVFSEKVKGVSGKAIKLYKIKGKKRVKLTAKVKVIKLGKGASINPSGSLGKGEYVLVFKPNKIRDLRGNFLAGTEIKLKR